MKPYEVTVHVVYKFNIDLDENLSHRQKEDLAESGWDKIMSIGFEDKHYYETIIDRVEEQ